MAFDPLVGRESELADAAMRLARGEIVTLVGPGGIGKSRLAEAIVEGQPSLWVDVADARSVVDVADAIAAIAGIVLPPRGDADVLAEALVSALVRREAVLVLDEAEGCIEAVRVIADHVRGAAPLLITSRVPFDDASIVLGPLDTSAAIELLVERISRFHPRFAPNEQERARLDELARAVSGYPLALELVAERLRIATGPEILAELARGPHRDLEQTIRATIDAVAPAARALLLTASVFAGMFGRTDLEELAGSDVLDPLSALVRTGLVRPLRPADLDATRRFAIPTPIRDLARAMAPPDLRARHATLCARRAAEGFARVGDDPVKIRDAVGELSAELVTVVRDRTGTPDEIAWCALAIDWPLRVAGRAMVRRDLLASVDHTGISAPLRAQLLSSESHALRESGDLDAARAAADRALAIVTDDPRARARAALERGVIAFLDRDLDRAEQLHSEALSHDCLHAEILANASTVALLRGDAPAAARLAGEALERARTAPSLGVFALAKLAEAKEALGSLDEARASLEQALRRAQDLPQLSISILAHLGDVLGKSGDHAQSIERFQQALARATDVGHVRLERAIRSALAAKSNSDVVLADDASAFRVRDELVSLARRPVLKKLLGALITKQVVDADALIAAGWPGERTRRPAARNRLYVALNELRKLGLKDVILRNDEGWYLDPTVAVNDLRSA
jgi:tetratricopeptide (TPR) repeat protein